MWSSKMSPKAHDQIEVERADARRLQFQEGEIDRMLTRLPALRMVTLDDAPDDVTWTNGGKLDHAEFLKRSTDMASR